MSTHIALDTHLSMYCLEVYELCILILSLFFFFFYESLVYCYNLQCQV